MYFTVVIYLKDVTAATSRESQPDKATNSCQSRVPTGEPGDGCDSGVPHHQLSHMCTNTPFPKKQGSKCRQQSPPPLSYSCLPQ